MKTIRLPLAILLALSLLLSPAASLAQSSPSSVPSSPPSALTLAEVNWCVAGSMNDWNNSSDPMYDDGTHGDLLAGDGVYSLSLSIALPVTHTWKAVECGNWGNTHPTNNSWFTASAANQAVTFTLDTNDYSANAGMVLLPAINIVNVSGDSLPTSFTAVGDFQGWNYADPNTLMVDMGNGYYRLVYTIPSAGSYIGKVVATGSWNGFGADGRSTNAANISFSTTTADQQVVFLLDSYTGRLLIQPAASSSGTWCAAGGFNGWTANDKPLYDDGTNGDLLGGDGIFTADVTIPTAGRNEWKVTNCTWDVTYPASNSWLNTSAADQVVKLSFDTNDHSEDAGWEMVPTVNIVHAWDSSSSFTAAGSFQGWENANPATALTALGYDLYRLDAPIATAGDYLYKVVTTGSWDAIGLDNRSINADNIPFTTHTDGDSVPFLLDYRSGRVGAFPPPAGEPPLPGHDNEVWWDYLGHDSRDTLYSAPGGPVTTGTAVTLRLRAAQGDLTAAKLRLYNDRTNVQSILPMSVAYSDGTYDWWEITIPASPDPTVYWYRFIAIDGTDTDYYEDDAARTMGWGQTFDETQDYSYQLTVYAADFQTPDWIKDAIVYQVFPDRFRDGDTANNKPAGTFFYNEPGGTVYRSLTEEWNTPICDPREAGECAGTYSKNFYGGDLTGLISKLDYLQELGVNTIYLNPIFESPSNHGYDTSDYMTINPMFGEPAEFFALVTALNNRGMHLILDGVFNHVSSDSLYFDRYSNFDEIGACESNTSPYRAWFYFTDVPAGTGPCVGADGTPAGANYESWWGYDSLPKLNSANPEVRALIWEYESDALATVAGYYMQYADGWRLDVGADVDPGTINDPSNDYWEGFRNTVKFVNPEGYITGEEWGIANSWLLGGEWDAVMNYQFSSAVLSLWRDSAFTDNDHNSGSSAGELTPLSMSQFDERMQNLMERYAPEVLSAMLNLFGSHDTSRALFMLDHNTYQNDPSLYQNPDYDWSDAISRLKGAVAVQMTMPGAPTIYYGDEVGLVGPMAYSGGKWEDDPYNRQPFPWLDASGTPFYTHLQTQDGQDAIYNYYAALTGERNMHPALRTGDYRTLLVYDSQQLYAYGRNLPGEDSAVVLINRNNNPQAIDLDVSGYLPIGTTYRDVLSTATYTVNSEGKLFAVSAPANGAAVLVRTNEQIAPPDPVELSAVTNGTEVTLTWTSSADATDYLVYRSYLRGGGYELRGETPATSYTDYSQVSGQRVYYIVVARDVPHGLISVDSNEVSALPAYNIDWANLQWPFTISHTIGSTPTENIYGQVYIADVSSAPGATPGLRAQVGYGPNESDPRDHAEWIWFDAAFSGQVGNNDEFVGALLPEAVGEYDYVYRYSTDGAASWVYAYEGGLVSDPYVPANAGDLTVTPSADVTPPSAPVLSVDDWSAAHIALAWTEASDDVAIYGYDLYRSTDGVSFAKLARVLAPELSYSDESVETGQMYYYKVKAVDTSFNFSDFSNIVSQTAEAKLVAVTFEVTVPDYTPGTVYLTRFINPNGTVGDWSPAATALSPLSSTLWTGTFDILDGTQFEFKFTRGSWETVIKGAGNEELPNLSLSVDYGADGTQLYAYTVLNWRDPIVVSVSPLDGTTGVSPYTNLMVRWSQPMPDDACPELKFGNAVIEGTCSYDSNTWTHTFTPNSSLPGMGLLTGLVTGKVDSGGDAQQVPFSWQFATDYYYSRLPILFR
ncbi:MAG: alpha-amylase family glycosyl hydrolase [Anaerolineaceae bacterium]